MRTFQELLDEVKKVDEVELLELLGITSEDIVNEYEDRVYDRQATIERYLGIDLEEEETNDRGN